MNSLLIIVYYVFGPFLFLALALLTAIYGGFIGTLIATRPRGALFAHLALLGGLVLAVSPLDVSDHIGGGNYSGSWPFPAFLGLLVRIDPRAYISSQAESAYREGAATVAAIAFGILFLSWGITAMVLRANRRSAQLVRPVMR